MEFIIIDRQTKTGLHEDGFTDPYKDPSTKDINSWIPICRASNDLDHSQARFILREIGLQFIDILKKEKFTKSNHKSKSECKTKFLITSKQLTRFLI